MKLKRMKVERMKLKRVKVERVWPQATEWLNSLQPLSVSLPETWCLAGTSVGSPTPVRKAQSC